MNKPVDEALSDSVAKQIGSKAKSPFENAYKAALITKDVTYVQGFLSFEGQPFRPTEHSWIEFSDRIVDPSLSHLGKKAADLYYFPAQSLTLKKLKAAIEEAKEDYPEDQPLPIYGSQPYEYYGDIMLGGKEYLAAYDAAMAKCKELNQPQFRNRN
ncbi:MAG: hypothetical protein DCF22_16720 [Leptolyngbya sp.]|nr:MAG: hypothetical protein DCF22_16720 [Leptolyngbya sp.]